MKLSSLFRRQWTLGQKLAGGFSLALLALGLVAGYGIFQMGSIDHALRRQLVPQIKHEFHLFTVRADLVESQLHLREYLAQPKKETIDEARGHVNKALKQGREILADTEEEESKAAYEQLLFLADNIRSELDETEALTLKIGVDPQSGLRGQMRDEAHRMETVIRLHDLSEASATLFDILKSARPARSQFAQLDRALNASAVEKGDLRPVLQRSAQARRRSTAANLRRLAAAFERVHLPGAMAAYLSMRRHEKDFLLRLDRKYLERHDQEVAKLRAILKSSPLPAGDKRAVDQQLTAYNQAFDQLAELRLKVQEQYGHVTSLALTVDAVIEGLSEEESQETAMISEAIDSEVNLSKTLLWVVSILGFLVTLVFAVWFVRSLTKMLLDLATNLNLSARQVAAASDEIAQSSEQLSQGATEQASSLEETSSSMEEMASQTEQNALSATRTAEEITRVRDLVAQSAENTENAATIANEARESAEKGASAMTAILEAMSEINQSSHEITDIIEVINEITHQTKMLATNAAIEAARAGEQGKGFAVVADEVSKLAESSKSAAKEIGGLIKKSSQRAQAGHEQATQGQNVLSEIVERNSTVEELMQELAESSRFQAQKMDTAAAEVADITNASKEQSEGIKQVSSAVVQMDQVTQNNAASAEQTASASQELSAQAQMLHQLVAHLALQVGAQLDQAETTPEPPPTSRTSRLELKPEDLRRLRREEKAEEEPQGDRPNSPLSRRVKPTEAIPLRDDFDEF